MSEQFLAEAARFELRSACCHCLHQARTGECRLAWPNQEQRRWPLDAPGPDGSPPAEVHFCKEFELA
ncbi:MAG TPA: hypothetical protein VNO33_21755 [Kofleriaceae bacterium]|nr:hypothetical protein [Kofleriaceae bacterium]